jgi:hypothetical protein
MRMIIEVRIEGGVEERGPIRLAEIERPDGHTKQLGLSLAEGKSLMYEVQRYCQLTLGIAAASRIHA